MTTYFFLLAILPYFKGEVVPIEGFYILAPEYSAYTVSLEPLTVGTWLEITTQVPLEQQREMGKHLELIYNYQGFQEALWFRGKAIIHEKGGPFGHCCGPIKHHRKVEVVEVFEFSSKPVKAFLKKHPQYVPPPGWEPIRF
ncbi:hypothetical protein [Acanthopleuribacter pedis]|uniref:Uncharacterized protein n=1 Tax=Acanthopleuribacter pedis TaxID=442870 RepID=A0A8J7U1A6_9BACT|nr:hypothetical protein [Acanthopleuribacter pedis]MBO1317973.1 hypothetical protein [Acanthopleuribacter pedis]